MTALLEVPVDGGPYAVAAGADGAMWVTLVHAGAVARVTADGSLTTFAVSPDSRPSLITAGRDGALWFTRCGDDRIGRITVDGEQSAVELTTGSAPFGLTVGPDDALWYTATGSGVVGRLDGDGTVQEWPVAGMPSMITAGPDGALWFTLNRAGAIGRLDLAGRLSTREVPTRGSGPVGICATHDDCVWFTAITGERLGRIPVDDAIQELHMPGKPHAVVADPAGGVWVSLWGADRIAHVSADGETVTIDLPAGSEPHGMAVAGDGALWVALEAGYVLRLPVTGSG